MERNKPVSGEFYRHFKGNLYQVKMLAMDSATQKEMVIYQAMYAPYTCWAMDLEEFMGRVDREKYPDVVQEYCFCQVLSEEMMSGQAGCHAVEREDGEAGREENAPGGEVSDQELVRALKSGQPERYLEHRMTEKEIAHRGLLKLLDAETFHEKRQILIGLKQYMDKHMINNIAVAFDIVLEEGDIETQYNSIMQCLEAFARYEGGRLR